VSRSAPRPEPVSRRSGPAARPLGLPGSLVATEDAVAKPGEQIVAASRTNRGMTANTSASFQAPPRYRAMRSAPAERVEQPLVTGAASCSTRMKRVDVRKLRMARQDASREVALKRPRAKRAATVVAARRTAPSRCRNHRARRRGAPVRRVAVHPCGRLPGGPKSTLQFETYTHHVTLRPREVDARASFLTAEWRHLGDGSTTRSSHTHWSYWSLASTELDSWRGHTLVSLVGFRFLNTRVLGSHCHFIATSRS